LENYWKMKTLGGVDFALEVAAWLIDGLLPKEA
jgi:hypothetical protein